MYLKRDIEETIIERSGMFKVLLITGPRQVGKSTTLKYLAKQEGLGRTYISLDLPSVRSLAKLNPERFIAQNPPPAIIDEVQYAPELFSVIKAIVDERQQFGDYWLSGSQVYPLMQGVTESLAGRVGLLSMHAMSQNELIHHVPLKELSFNLYEWENHPEVQNHVSQTEMMSRVFEGGLPELKAHPHIERATYFESYVGTYLERDVRRLSGGIDVVAFRHFLEVVALRNGQMLNYAKIASDCTMSPAKAKKWVGVLEKLGLITLLRPYFSNELMRLVKAPKLHFFDTGLVCYLAKIETVEQLQTHAMAGALFETFVIAELMKRSVNLGKRSDTQYYYRDRDGAEIDWILAQSGHLHPAEIKMTTHADSRMARTFRKLDTVREVRSTGAVISCDPKPRQLDARTIAIPAALL